MKWDTTCLIADWTITGEQRQLLMIFTITAQCRSKGMITSSVVRTVWKQRYTLQNKKSEHSFIYLEDYVIQRRMNKQSGFNVEQIEKDKYPESKTVWRLNLNNELTQQNKNRWLVKSTSNDKRRLHISLSSPLSSETYTWLLVSKLTTCVTSQALNWEIIFFPIKVFSSLSPCWFFIRRGEWRKLPRKVSYNRTFSVPDQGQTLDVWESQTTESALRWQTHHIAPRHILELTLEVVLEHMLGIKTMTRIFNPGSRSKSLSLPRN